MVTRRRLAACAFVLLLTACTRTPRPDAADDQQTIERDVAAWAEPFAADSDWAQDLGPFTVQMEATLHGRRLLLRGVSVV